LQASRKIAIVQVLTCLLLLQVAVDAGFATIGLCYTACNAGYVTCMSGSGLVAGTTGPVGWWAWLTSAAAGCSAVQGSCMAMCAASFVVTP